MYNIYIYIYHSLCVLPLPATGTCASVICLLPLHWSIVTSCETPRPPLHDELQPLKTTQLVATSAVQWPLITSANDNWKAVCCTPYISWKLSSNQKRTLVHLPGLLSSHQQDCPWAPSDPETSWRSRCSNFCLVSSWNGKWLSGWGALMPWNHQREVSWQINKASWGVCIWRRI